MISLGIVLGLTSSLAFGLLDILISFASRFIGAMRSLVLAQSISTCILLGYLIGFFTADISLQSLPLLLLVGGSLGLVNSFANVSLYRGLAIGPVALVSPISAAYGLVTTILAVSLFHEMLSPLQGTAVALILAGVLLSATDSRSIAVAIFIGSIPFVMLVWLGISAWLVVSFMLSSAICVSILPVLALLSTHPLPHISVRSLPQIKEWWLLYLHKHKGPLFALGSMIGFGIEFFGISIATERLGPTEPILWSRLFSVIMLLIYASRKRVVSRWSNIKLKHVVVLALIGLLDTLGMLWYDQGTSQSATSIVAALSSTYTLLPTLVGIIVYHERLAFLQWTGVATLMIGIVMLSLGGR